MGLIQRADLPERIRRAFGLREPGVGATLSPEIVPVAVVEDLTGPSIDEGYPRLAVARCGAGAVVAQFSEVFLINPATSRTDVIVQEIWVRRLTAAGDIHVCQGLNTALAGMSGVQATIGWLDGRVSGKPGAYVDSQDSAGVLGTSFITFRTAVTTTPIYLPLQMTIPPGQFVSLYPDANNQAIAAHFFFYERLRTTT